MNGAETKTCQNCKNSFVIEPEDFEFYDKIKVPPPTFCPECRMIRRGVFRNERTFYKRPCDLCKKGVISIYNANTTFPVYYQECWWSDKWDSISYGSEYDLNKSFFEQYKELRNMVPRVAIINKGGVDSPYTNLSANNKNCYFLIESSNNEDRIHSYWLENQCKSVVDSSFLTRVEIAYESLLSWQSFKLFFSKDSRECSDSYFLNNCVNVSHSLCCINLRNKQNHIFNEPFSKEDYEQKIAEMDLGSYSSLVALKERSRDFSLLFPRRFAYTVKSVDVTGDYVVSSKNVKYSFFVEDGENIKYAIHTFDKVRDNMDTDVLGIGGELCYESMNTALGVNRMNFCVRCWTGHNSSYCDNCDDSRSSFACIGLRNKQHCILNKQYAKEEYETLVPKIIQHMNDMPYTDKRGIVYKYGEFFPPELSPFSYNETIAQEYFPLTKAEAESMGYRWKDPYTKEYNISIQSKDLPDHIKDVKDNILEQTIGCEHEGGCNEQCSTAYRIIPQELEFYRKMNLPLPRLCPNCRHYHRLKQRNPLKLWHRGCQCSGDRSSNGVYTNTTGHQHGSGPCPNEFETSYALDRPEIIYCETCYQNEVV